MSYVVLARKWRPQSFEDLVGQEHVSSTIGNAIQRDRVAHAFLFTGVRGVGKTTSARILAKSLNCEKGPTPTPCQVCPACKEITNGSDVDVQEIDGASYTGVDDVRKLQESMPYRPQRDRFKIFIVDEVHMLSVNAWNAFLKTLEEPPPHVKFIFATTEVHKVPVTILSRCQRYDFKLISAQAIAARLKFVLEQEKIAAEDGAIATIAREAAGSMRDAMSLLDQVIAWVGTTGDNLTAEGVAKVLGVADRQVLHRLAAALVDGDAAACVRIVGELAQEGYDIPHVAKSILSFLRDLAVAKVCAEPEKLLDLAQEEIAEVSSLAARADADDLVRLHQGFSKAFDDIVRGGQPRASLEMALIRLARRPALLPVDELLRRLGDLERRLGGGGGPAPAGPGGGGAGPGRGGASPPGRGGAGSWGGGGAPTRSAEPARAQEAPRAAEPVRTAEPARAAEPAPVPERDRSAATAPAPDPAAKQTPAAARPDPAPERPQAAEPLRVSEPARPPSDALPASISAPQRPPFEAPPPGSAPQRPSFDALPPGSSPQRPTFEVPPPSSAPQRPTFEVPPPSSAPQRPAFDSSPPGSGPLRPSFDATPASSPRFVAPSPGQMVARPTSTPPPVGQDVPPVSRSAAQSKPSETIHRGAPAAPAAPTRPASDQEIADWRRVLGEVRKRRPALASVLAHAQIFEMSAERVTLGYDQTSFLFAQATEPAAKDLLTSVVRSCFEPTTEVVLEIAVGQTGTTIAELDTRERKAKTEQAKRDVAAHPLVVAAIQALGAELIDVRLVEVAEAS